MARLFRIAVATAATFAAAAALAGAPAEREAGETRLTIVRAAMPISDEGVFETAPMGVDPIVTGPVSAAFKARREAAGCDQAVWPNIPRACWPD